MSEITLTINGRQVKGSTGDTVLEVCQANGIDVPTLCHLKGLTNVGACRLCVVEIEKERRPVPSCTYPARDGLVVKTDTENLEKYRKQMLELIFTERNHFCMFCEQSGDCELQNLAYRYQMDHVRYPHAFPSLPVDSISEYLVIDHNRCILCGRCIRSCGEIAASHTLEFSQRGWKTFVTADLEQPIGESSCRSCGVCVQACPTGALFTKLSAYKGKTDECEQIETVCPVCSVGCALNVLVKDNKLVRIEAPDQLATRGALCKKGRFDLLKPVPQRITTPMIKNERGQLEPCSIEKAANIVVEKMVEANGDFAGIVSTRLPNETLAAFNKLMGDILGSKHIDTTDGDIYRTIQQGIKMFDGTGSNINIGCSIEEIAEADCVMVVGCDPEETNPVVGTLVRQALDKNDAKLIVINTSSDVFPLRTDIWLKPNIGTEKLLVDGLTKVLIDKGLSPKEDVNNKSLSELKDCQIETVAEITSIEKERIEIAAELYGNANKAVIIFGKNLIEEKNSEAIASLLRLADISGNKVGDKLRIIALSPNANSQGAWDLGIARNEDAIAGTQLFLLLGDDESKFNDTEFIRSISGAKTLVVQASYKSSITDMADVVLPSPIWAEREGSYVSMGGHTLEARKAIQPFDGLLSDKEVLTYIARVLGHELS